MKTATAPSHDKHILYFALATLAVLAVPAIAMQFSEDVQWGPFDFAIIGILLFGAGFLYELVARKVTSRTHRVALGLGFLVAVGVIWVELAVGIFD